VNSVTLRFRNALLKKHLNLKMGKKLGRNQPCWCVSGKKYKYCHLNRHEDEPIPQWEAENRLREAYSAKYCSCPESMKHECSGRIVKAHTVSKSSSLKQIARNGHVYAFKPSLKSISTKEGLIVPELLGINKASTFTGFCSFHDKILFSEIEDKKFNATSEQVFLVGYRSLSKEYFNKMAQNDFQEVFKEVDKGRSEEEQFRIQEFAFLHSIGVAAGVRDVKIHKDYFDTILVGKNFDEVRGFVIEFDKVLPILCSGAMYPEVDFKGKKLQDLAELEKALDNICFSLFCSEGSSYAVFTWLKDSDKTCEEFINSLESINDKDMFSSVARFVFQSFENVFIEPVWWESQPKTIKENISKRLAAGANPIIEVKDNCLMDDGINYGSYSVKSK